MAQKGEGERTLAMGSTNLACRIPHRPVHSTACSSPRFDKGCKCQRTSGQSENEQGGGRESQGVSLRLQTCPTPKGLRGLPVCLTVPSPYLQSSPRPNMSPQETTVIHNCTKLFIQSPHFIAVEGDEPPSKDTELLGEDLGWAGQ